MKNICIFMAVLFLLIILMGTAIVLLSSGSTSIGGDKVGLIRIEGPIFESKKHIERIKDYAEDTGIKVIVLRVDSPGGAVAPSQEIYEEVKKAKEKKEVVVSMGTVAASGGYYVAAPASLIYANPGTITGSIGVIMEIPNIQGLMDKIGVKSTVIKSGRYKDMASAFREMSPDERQLLEGVILDVHDQFIEAVAEGRKIDIEKVREFADGRIFSGRQAKELGLVDRLGNIEDAIKGAAELAGIEGEPDVVTPSEEKGIYKLLEGFFQGGVGKAFEGASIKYMLSL